MIIISAYDEKMAWYCRNLMDSGKAHLYAIDAAIVEVSKSDTVGVQKSITFKPSFVLHKINQHWQHNGVLWVDADCLIRDRVDELDDMGADLIVTTRKNQWLRNEFSGYINSGVVYISNIKVAEEWVKLTEQTGKDQTALHHLALDYYNTFNIVEVPCEVYNNFYFPDTNGAKILHFKGETRKLYKDYV